MPPCGRLRADRSGRWSEVSVQVCFRFSFPNRMHASVCSAVVAAVRRRPLRRVTRLCGDAAHPIHLDSCGHSRSHVGFPTPGMARSSGRSRSKNRQTAAGCSRTLGGAAPSATSGPGRIDQSAAGTAARAAARTAVAGHCWPCAGGASGQPGDGSHSGGSVGLFFSLQLFPRDILADERLSVVCRLPAKLR